MYKCMICGAEHKNLDDYAACVAACNQKVKAEQKKRLEEKFSKEKNARIESIAVKYNDLIQEVKSFIKDYGYNPISFLGIVTNFFDNPF